MTIMLLSLGYTLSLPFSNGSYVTNSWYRTTEYQSRPRLTAVWANGVCGTSASQERLSVMVSFTFSHTADGAIITDINTVSAQNTTRPFGETVRQSQPSFE